MVLDDVAYIRAVNRRLDENVISSRMEFQRLRETARPSNRHAERVPRH